MQRTLDLTQSQLLLWTGQQLNPESPLYNMAFAFELSGTIEVEHFRAAFHKLVAQSDALRTVFVVENEVPKQKVLEYFPCEMEVLDWTEGIDAAAAFSKWAEERAQQLFELDKCLFDSVLIKISEQKHYWFFNEHHLITDAWTSTLIYNTLSDYYQKSLTGQLAEVEELHQFQEYIEYEQLARSNPKKQNLHEHWKQKAKGVTTPPSLYGYPRLEAGTYSERILVDLGAERSEKLRALALEKDLRSWTVHSTLFNLFSTALFTYLYRVSGQQQLAIGTPAHNRVTKEFKSTIGVFIELFPLMNEIEADETFLSLFKKVRTEVNEFLRYAQPGTSTAELNRGFNVVLNYIHAQFKDFNDIPTNSKWIHANHCDPRHHLRMQVYDFDDTGTIQIYFDLNHKVFDAALRQNAPQHFLKIVDALLADRTQKIDVAKLITASEEQQTLHQINQTKYEYPIEENTLELFENQVNKTPKDIAITHKETTITYEELDKRANQLAHFLLLKGIQPKDRIALHLKRSPGLLVSILATWKIGATYIPVASDLPPERIKMMLEEGAVALTITTSKLLERFQLDASKMLQIDREQLAIQQQLTSKPEVELEEDALAYIMFTSGSTGKPKGVQIAHTALSNYLLWAKKTYVTKEKAAFPLFTMIGFDLTVTSTFLPLISGGNLVIYEESEAGPDLALLEVIEENVVDAIKLTPSHLSLLKDKDLRHSRISTMIVGGEDFKSQLAQNISDHFPKDLAIYNEYGPTEATVGCVVHRFAPEDTAHTSVPIGTPIANMQVYILDKAGNPVPKGVAGELYLAGEGLANGYWQQEVLTNEKFVQNPFQTAGKMYRTGDLARINRVGELEYLGRVDKQVKIGGIRVELAEIETALSSYSGIQTAIVELWEKPAPHQQQDLHYCTSCGLPSNYPNVEFDEEGVCNFCHSFESFQQKAHQYFKNLEDLRAIFQESQKRKTGEYDCMMLLSGGKDSTYALGQLVEMGYKVLAFTLDNGYISQQALDNVQRVADDLGVDCVVGSTPAMNEIFVDSLHRHCNVCNGCFKTIYTLSTQIALEKGIPIIVTGLSRGQFFETRLTEELFWNDEVDIAGIDQIILNARKEYHRVDDAVKRLLDTSAYQDDRVFEQVQYVDFYRYTDVSLQEMYAYLDKRLPWVRPTDTGRSTNCLINKLGIFVHTKEQGYSNYAFPYSWDVRMGHKQRDTAIDEINEPIDEPEVRQMMEEIGYVDQGVGRAGKQELIAFYVAPQPIEASKLRLHLAKHLPEYMIPTRFHRLDELPLTQNGKIDRKALPQFEELSTIERTNEYVAPETQLEEMLADLWAEVLQIEKVGATDDFLALGGNSLEAIRLTARISKTFELELPLNTIFEYPTIRQLATKIEGIIEQLLAEME